MRPKIIQVHQKCFQNLAGRIAGVTSRGYRRPKRPPKRRQHEIYKLFITFGRHHASFCNLLHAFGINLWSNACAPERQDRATNRISQMASVSQNAGIKRRLTICYLHNAVICTKTPAPNRFPAFFIIWYVASSF